MWTQLKYQAFAEAVRDRQDCKNNFSSCRVHKAGLLFLPQHPYVTLNIEVIVDSSILRAWTPHTNSLSDRNDPYQELFM